MRTFGERLRQLRDEKQLSQRDLGKLFSLSQSTIAYYELDQKEPPQTTLQRFADFFGTSVDFLLGRTDDPRPSVTGKGKEPITDPEFTDLLYRVKDLTEEEKQSLKEHWEWSIGIIEEERQRRKKFKDKFGSKEPGGKR